MVFPATHVAGSEWHTSAHCTVWKTTDQSTCRTGTHVEFSQLFCSKWDHQLCSREQQWKIQEATAFELWPLQQGKPGGCQQSHSAGSTSVSKSWDQVHTQIEYISVSMKSLLYTISDSYTLLAVIIATSRLTGICLFVAKENLGTTLLFMPTPKNLTYMWCWVYYPCTSA